MPLNRSDRYESQLLLPKTDFEQYPFRLFPHLIVLLLLPLNLVHLVHSYDDAIDSEGPHQVSFLIQALHGFIESILCDIYSENSILCLLRPGDHVGNIFMMPRGVH